MEKQHTEDELRLSGLAAEAARHRRDRQRLEGRLEAAQAGRSDLVGLVEALRQGMELLEQAEAAGVQAHARVHKVCRHEYTTTCFPGTLKASLVPSIPHHASLVPSKLPWCPPYPIMPLYFPPYFSVPLRTSPHLTFSPSSSGPVLNRRGAAALAGAGRPPGGSAKARIGRRCSAL